MKVFSPIRTRKTLGRKLFDAVLLKIFSRMRRHLTAVFRSDWNEMFWKVYVTMIANTISAHEQKCEGKEIACIVEVHLKTTFAREFFIILQFEACIYVILNSFYRFVRQICSSNLLLYCHRCLFSNKRSTIF